MINTYQSMTPGGVKRRAAIQFRHFSKIKIPFPPLPEQEKIAFVHKIF